MIHFQIKSDSIIGAKFVIVSPEYSLKWICQEKDKIYTRTRVFFKGCNVLGEVIAEIQFVSEK